MSHNGFSLMKTDAGEYIGSELNLFAKAIRWKRYFRSSFQQYLKGDVLEVGAGLGGTSEVLCDGSQTTWVCLEPDHTMTSSIEFKIRSNELPSCCRARNGVISDLDVSETFDAILYIDVLEHIEDDKAEVSEATKHLKPGGNLIILSPAHQSLYSPFDKAIGHYRRYSLQSMKEAVPDELKERSLFYLDSIGYLVSFANRLLLKQSMPTEKQILFWDRILIPISQVIDPLLSFRFGKTAVGIWEKP